MAEINKIKSKQTGTIYDAWSSVSQATANKIELKKEISKLFDKMIAYSIGAGENVEYALSELHIIGNDVYLRWVSDNISAEEYYSSIDDNAVGGKLYILEDDVLVDSGKTIAKIWKASAYEYGYAMEGHVKDGNDTAISVAKAIKTETDKIGTSTSATNNTLFKAIENIDFDTSDLAKEVNATANKNEIKSYTKDMTSLIMGHIHEPYQQNVNCNCIFVANTWFHYDGMVNSNTVKWLYIDTASTMTLYTNSGTIAAGTYTYLNAAKTQRYNNVDAVKTLVLASEENATANKQAIIAAIGSIDMSSVAQRTDVKDGEDTTIGMLKNATYGLSAIKSAMPTIPTDYAKQGNDASVTLTGVDTKIGDLDDIITAINGDTIDGILAYYTDSYANDLQSIIGTSNNG